MMKFIIIYIPTKEYLSGFERIKGKKYALGIRFLYAMDKRDYTIILSLIY